nr:hypothetical protein [Sphingobium indicum]
MADELIPVSINVELRPECALAALIFRPGIDERPLASGKRRLVIIALDQILANFRADIFEEPPQPPDDGIVAPHRMERLEKVVEAGRGQDRADHEQGNRPDAWQIIASDDGGDQRDAKGAETGEKQDYKLRAFKAGSSPAER